MSDEKAAVISDALRHLRGEHTPAWYDSTAQLVLSYAHGLHYDTEREEDIGIICEMSRFASRSLEACEQAYYDAWEAENGNKETV